MCVNLFILKQLLVNIYSQRSDYKGTDLDLELVNSDAFTLYMSNALI